MTWRGVYILLAALLMPTLATHARAAQPTPQSIATFRAIHFAAHDPAETGVRVPPHTYRNPIIPGFHPDPSIVRVGSDYYLVNSSFAYFPGLPIFHSRDLVHWAQIADAIATPDMFNFRGLGIARGVFAPTLRHHRGTFYLINTCVECGGNYLITAHNPRGPWSKPMLLPGVGGIDPDIFFDDDGRTWIANNDAPNGAARYDGHRAIWLQELDITTMRMIGNRRVIVDAGVHPEANPIWTEGPHIFKRGGFYYLITAEGGTAGQHSETVYRAQSVSGPYVAGPANPILTQRDLDPARPNPVYATGHADFVETAAGDWWAVFLGARPYRSNLSSMGRETFMLPVRWADGWPVILPPGRAVPIVSDAPRMPHAGAERAKLPKNSAGLGWVMLRTPVQPWAHWTKSGALSLTAQAESLSGSGNPSFLARRQEQRVETVSVDLDYAPSRIGDHAGLAIFADENHLYTFGMWQTAEGKALVVTLRNGADTAADGHMVAHLPLTADVHRISLRLDIRDPEYRFDFRLPGQAWKTLLDHADSSALASEASNQFTGAVLGPYAARASSAR